MHRVRRSRIRCAPRPMQPDQGSEHLASTVRHLKASAPHILVECLAPDFRGEVPLIAGLATSGLDVFANNLETVSRLQVCVIDHRAGYKQSLGVLQAAKAAVEATGGTILTKTSLMLGLGETMDEVRETMRDIRSAGI